MLDDVVPRLLPRNRELARHAIRDLAELETVTPHLVHSDLMGQNMIWSGDALAGVIDKTMRQPHRAQRRGARAAGAAGAAAGAAWQPYTRLTVGRLPAIAVHEKLSSFSPVRAQGPSARALTAPVIERNRL